MRKICIEILEYDIIDEIYWVDGLVFSLFLKNQQENEMDVIYMKIHDLDYNPNTKNKIVIQIKLMVNKNIEDFFTMVHQSMLDFSSQWANSLKDLEFTIERKLVNNGNYKENLKIQENECITSKKEDYKEILCCYCGSSILFINNQTKNCNNCLSTNFLVEKEFAILKGNFIFFFQIFFFTKFFFFYFFFTFFFL